MVQCGLTNILHAGILAGQESDRSVEAAAQTVLVEAKRIIDNRSK